jgi:hypothetical protein
VLVLVGLQAALLLAGLGQVRRLLQACLLCTLAVLALPTAPVLAAFLAGAWVGREALGAMGHLPLEAMVGMLEHVGGLVDGWEAICQCGV